MASLLRIVHLADLHFDEHRRLGGLKRQTSDGRPYALMHTAECVRHVVTSTIRDGVDLWIVAGDVFERPQPTSYEQRVAIELFSWMAQHAPLLIIAGNHDIPLTRGQADGLECLRRRESQRVYVVDKPCLVSLVPDVHKRPDLVVLDVANPPPVTGELAVVACVPYPRRGELAMFGEGLTKEERNAKASGALRQALFVLRGQALDRGVPAVLVYHGSVAGARINEQPRTLAGDIVLEPADLEGWSYVGAGHIHQQQELSPGVWYSGSVDRCNFGEAKEAKGALAVEIRSQRRCEVTAVETPATRYVTLDAIEFAKTQGDALGDGWDPDVVYRVKDGADEAEAAVMRARVNGLAESGVWITDALEVKTDVRLRDEEATGQEDSESFLRRWLSKQQTETLAEAAGTSPVQLAEDTVAMHRGLEEAIR